MNANRTPSDEIFELLVRMGLEGPAGVVLEAARPLAALGSQAAYILEPIVGGRGGWMNALARTLEDEAEIEALMMRLRQEAGE